MADPREIQRQLYVLASFSSTARTLAQEHFTGDSDASEPLRLLMRNQGWAEHTVNEFIDEVQRISRDMSGVEPCIAEGKMMALAILIWQVGAKGPRG